MRTPLLGLFVLCLAACGSGDGGTGTGGGTGAGGSNGGDTLSGACAAATVHDGPFSVTATVDAWTSALELSCDADMTAGQAAHAFTLAQAATVAITASDESGQGVGVEMRAPDCTSASGNAACVWQSNGDLHQSFDLGAGTWVIVVQRKPTGKYSLAASW